MAFFLSLPTPVGRGRQEPQRMISDAIDEGDVVSPSLPELMLGSWTPEMDKEIDVSLERVFDRAVAERALPDNRRPCLGDHEAIGRKPEHPTKP
jgi:hypothetical protein